ncbi:hypothetical protein BGZ67_009279 [Mortierella alpina]|nr:hypothetical protein BGZ67_009279 [Mortierella alpina]
MRFFFKSFAIASLATLVLGTPVPPVQTLSRRAESPTFPTTTQGAIAGLNNWDCKPSREHPNALVLVHALFPNDIINWFYMAPKFVAEGYCVFSLSYGAMNNQTILFGLDSMETSAQQLADFIDRVLAATNTNQVDILGQSEGSLMPRYYLKHLGGAPKVHKFAGISSIQYGTTLGGLTKVLASSIPYDSIKESFDSICRSCPQLLVDSPFLKELNEGGDTVPGVQYLMIGSRLDLIVTPYTNGFLKDKNPNVRNQILQDWCATDLSEHIFQAFDRKCARPVNMGSNIMVHLHF